MSDSHNPRQTAADLIEQIGKFDGDPSGFLQHILAAQCIVGDADGGAFLGSSQEQSVAVLALYPQHGKVAEAPSWLTGSVEVIREALSKDTMAVGQENGAGHVLVFPLKLPDVRVAAAAFLIEDCDGGRGELDARREKLELLVKVLELLNLQPGREQQSDSLRQMHRAMETLSVVNRQGRFASAAMAFCNEVATQWQCERVSIGFLKGRYVQIKAMSHTEDFSRKMEIVQDMESAMEECLDQDIEIVSPSAEETAYVVRATEHLSKRHGPLAVLSLPLRNDNEVKGVLTLERPREKAFTPGEIETVRLTCELAGTRLLNLYEQDRWFGARFAGWLRCMIGKLVGPTHTWAKVTAILVLAGIVFLTFGKGRFRVKAPFVLQAMYQQVVPAPFDGFLEDVEVEVGDLVEGGESVLGRIDTSELRLRLAASKAERHGYVKQEAAAMRDGETAQAQIARANADKTSAQIDLFEYMIDQAELVSPVSGTVVTGDLKREIGAPVKTGDILFEVAPLESLRAELMVREDEVFDIEVGQEGFLATASYPGERIKFIVERINPMAEVIEQRNVFRVRVQLLEIHEWMRPGMEGVAKVSIGKRHYVWIWTRKIVNWIRMKLWL